MGVSAGKIMMPLWSSERPSSFSEQSIPGELTPRTFVSVTVNSSESFVPTVASATMSPFL